MPLNFTAGRASPLNPPYIRASLPVWPDARMLSYLEHGVRFLTCRFKSYSFRTSSPYPTSFPPCKRRLGACKPGAGLTSSSTSPTFPFA
eukprot:1275333-Pleurochrysis_carterae.AAC.1